MGERSKSEDTPLRAAVMGTGYWANLQIPAWSEVQGVEVVALYNRTVAKAERAAAKFGVPRAYADPEELLEGEDPDLVDIVTEVPAHAPLVFLAARHRVPVVCQKPMAPDYQTSEAMVRACREADVPWPTYPWEDPDLCAAGAGHAIVLCHRHLTDCLRSGRRAETSAEENLKTMRLVFAAIESAETGRVVTLDGTGGNLPRE